MKLWINIKINTFIFMYSFVCVIVLSGITQAQNSLTHNTGTLKISIIDNGYLGDDANGTYGGVVFNGNQNELYTAGFIAAGGALDEAYGNIGSFTSGGVPVIEDLYNGIPITGFYSSPYFNQITNHTFDNIINSDLDALVESFSNTGDDFVFIKVTISNNSYSNWTGDYYGIFADWNIGNYALNKGGYDLPRDLFYMYENVTGTNNYYGIMGVNMEPNSIRGTIIADFSWTPANLRNLIYDFIISTDFDPITTLGDYKMFISSGPHSIPAGGTLSFDWAIVVGTSLADLQANADKAILYGQHIITAVEPTSDVVGPQTFSLEQNYPNPFNPSTKINYQIPELSFVTLKVFDVLGNEVKGLVNEEKSIGSYNVEFDGTTLSSGIYFYRLQAGSFGETKKMVLMK